jgi:hypothetical protein
MEIEFNFELSDWMEFQKHFLRNSKQFKRSKLIVASMLPLAMISILTIDFLNGKFNPFMLIIFTITSILWIMFYPKRMNKRAIDRTRKMLENGDNSGILGIHKLIFNTDEIIHTQPDSEQKIKWKGIKKLEQSETHYFLFDTAVSAIIIPKQKIKGNIEQLELLLKNKIA